MKNFSGKARRIKTPIVGVITKRDIGLLGRPGHILTGTVTTKFGYSGTITTLPEEMICLSPVIFDVDKKSINQLNEGDIVYLNGSGSIHVIWEATSATNSILVTEKCNCKCLMCPQPPKEDDPCLDSINYRLLALLGDDSNQPICLTGGEPTLNKTRFLSYLKIIKDKMPQRGLDVLTNAQPLSDFNYASEVSKLIPGKTTFCVSLHSDTSDLHNIITGSKNGFHKTILGIQNLAILGIPVELRFVITKLNYKRIVSFAKFVQRNMPFVVHVAYMSLETIGHAEENLEQIWIDPVFYKDELSSATKYLTRAGMAVSIYNTPLCLLNNNSWSFARQSISKWKNSFTNKCMPCVYQSDCCGIFSTSTFVSQNIKPITSREV